MKQICTCRTWLVALWITFIFPLFLSCSYSTEHIYLTWQNSPHTTMTVQVQTSKVDSVMEICYGEGSCAVPPYSYPSRLPMTKKQIPGLETEKAIYLCELTNLTPGKTYYFRVNINGERYSEEYKFRTVPNNGSPLRFIVGGDMGTLPVVDKLLKHSAEQDPQFVAIGGDIAYANGDIKNLFLWEIWFTRWCQNMVTKDGYLIPIVAGIGNHEVNSHVNSSVPEERAPFYFNYFAQGGKTYFVLRFEPHVALIVLDSNHIATIEEQTPWLEQVFESCKSYPFIIPVYHVPMYPSHRDFDGAVSALERKFWLPLFDRYAIPVVFEHHDHTFKRTKPLRNNQPSIEGTVYLGDGCYGVLPRTVNNCRSGYLEKADSKRHFWFVEVTKDRLTATAIDENGKAFDSVMIRPRQSSTQR